MKRKSPNQYTESFKKEAINLILEQGYTVQQAASALGITTKLLYAWRKRPVKPLDDDMLELHQRACSLFRESRQSLGYRMLAAQLRKEGYAISDY